MRRQIGEALHDMEEAEKIAPEQTRTHRIAREITRDLLHGDLNQLAASDLVNATSNGG
jgi:hypothetical protein